MAAFIGVETHCVVGDTIFQTGSEFIHDVNERSITPLFSGVLYFRKKLRSKGAIHAMEYFVISW
ncbi:unannotated protein [freshwater metagenome]|uniref:Unannotated protein n=1 Tax=freshwater metagenome TaxID=449393 RepID=A0A6J6DVL4_9ZZZZ